MIEKASSGYFKNKKISASQISLWSKSPKEYIKQYIIGQPFIGNKYTEFGSLIHKKIETDDVEMEKIPKLKNREFYFEKEFSGVILNGYIDSYDIGEIIDYKVSKKNKWSQKIVDNHEQLDFYGLWHKLEHDILPKVSIVHIESDEKNGQLYLTGETSQYIKQITEQDIEKITSKINQFIEWCNEYERTNN